MDQRERRRKDERDRQRQEILGVALKAFAASGFDGTSMNAIAAESGYSVGHIYNVVGNKSVVFDEVLIGGGNSLVERISAVEAAHAEDPVGAINGVVDTVLDFFDKNRDFFEIYLLHAAGVSVNVERVFSPAVVELKTRIDDRIRRLFRQAAHHGITADLPVADMAMAFGELVNGFIAVWAAGGYRGRISRKSKVIKHLVWKGIGA